MVCDKLLDRGFYCSLREAEVLIHRWRQHYNAVRPQRAGIPTAGAGSDVALAVWPCLRSGNARRPSQNSGQLSHGRWIPPRGQAEALRTV